MAQQDSPLSSDKKPTATDQQLYVTSTDLALLHALRRPKWRLDFEDSSREWRRFFAEIMGTFMLVVVAAGAGLLSTQGVGMSRVAAVVAPGLMVMAIILSIGTISGAHLNPVVTFAFAFRSSKIEVQLHGRTFGHQNHLGITVYWFASIHESHGAVAGVTNSIAFYKEPRP